MTEKAQISWKKADKPFPKKSSTVSSFFNYNRKEMQDKINEIIQIDHKFEESNEKIDQFIDIFETKTNKVTIKDLCPEEKARIANLIKEIAKINEEKQNAEDRLEEERKKKEDEIKEILKQQEELLNERETLLKKFSKTQQKLAKLQKEKLENLKLNEKNKKKANESTTATTTLTNTIEATNVQKSQSQIENQKDNDVFNPFKSSTPKNLSPRSLSPIISDNLNQIRTSNEIIDDPKKLELMKERMILAEEQNKLKRLLEQQEEILKQKQSEIMIQQKLHLERLEELSRIKAESLQPIFKPNILNPHLIPIQPPPNHLNQFYPVMTQYPINTCAPVQTIQKEESGSKINELDDESLENLANIVFKKMMLKKKTKIKENLNKSKDPLLEKNSHNSKQNDLSVCNSQQDDDDHLIDLIIQETNSLNKSKIKNSLKSNKHEQDQIESGLDLEESKLIEDLFFIK